MGDAGFLVELPGLHDDILLWRILKDAGSRHQDESGTMSEGVFLVALGLIALAFCGCFVM